MKKKIVHIISSAIWRGCEQQVHFLFNHQSDDFDNYLFCPEGAELKRRNSDKGDKIFTYKKWAGLDFFATLKLKKVCTRNKIDLIHLHDSHAINTYLLADLMGMNIPAIIHRHVNHPITSKWKYNHKKIIKIICVSETVKTTVSKMVPEEKLVVVHPAIDVKKFERKSIIKTGGEFTVGIISALEKEKNIEEFIEIANKISSQKEYIKFIVVGDGSLKFDLKSNYNPNISFLGFRNDIPEILSSINLFLFTSKSEGWGIVLLEAMAAKVPVVCANFPAAAEMIQDGKTGFIYKDVNHAVQLIEHLRTTNDLRLTTIENAYHFVQQFDVTLMNEKIEEVYQSVFKHA